MNDTVRARAPAADAALTVLCVDDEANILNALRRLLRPHGYRVLTAGSGAEGLAMLAGTTVDLVLSDMRMPEMDGARFLEEVKARSPATARILLTGFADLSSTIAAINKAEIYRYISKPWDDVVVLGVIADALERKKLEREKTRLEHLTAQQNDELRALNATLESKVEARTADLATALSGLEEAHGKLKKGFVTSIKVFSNLIELHEGARAGHSRRVGELARRLAQHMKLADSDVYDVSFAGLLHGIGEFGLPEALLRMPFESLKPDERARAAKHPQNAQAALTALEQLSGAGTLIAGYRERFDGTGYPDRLSGAAIPLGSRILAVAHDFEAALEGVLTGTALTREHARGQIFSARGKRYDPTVVAALVEILGSSGASRAEERSDTAAASASERAVTVADLRAGMVLTRDLLTPDGVLLLSQEAVLDGPLIERLIRFAKRDERELTIYISEPEPVP